MLKTLYNEAYNIKKYAGTDAEKTHETSYPGKWSKIHPLDLSQDKIQNHHVL
jgi:hypothetical protein